MAKGSLLLAILNVYMQYFCRSQPRTQSMQILWVERALSERARVVEWKLNEIAKKHEDDERIFHLHYDHGAQ